MSRERDDQLPKITTPELERLRKIKHSGGVWDKITEVMGKIYAEAQKEAVGEAYSPEFDATFYLLSEGRGWVGPEGRIAENSPGGKRLLELMGQQTVKEDNI